MNDESLTICPECGNPLNVTLPVGLCAACLMQAGLQSNSGRTGEFPDEYAEQAGSQIGPYKLLEQIGEGGFGVVFMAEQLEPVRRRVALKVIKPGMDSRQIVARFEAERQALAMMDHENIARVLDAGTTENGRPYFVMELVRGIPITEYCDRGKLPPPMRLELMINVCRAIQHAHQKGIIHRDVKPSNVLVTLYDGRPVPKVIDFGVAKAIQQPLTDKTMFTRFGQVMGTLEYMSPEQAEMSGLDIDTRGDIYSLGVMMYELLTGSTPIRRERLKTAAIDEVLRLIRDEEPERPSLRLDQSGDAKQTISSQRGMAPEKLGSVLQGELDWIVMKALEKDRSRRYGTANDFAADIQRFLDNEPIVAAPPSTAYRVRKFVAKNRLVVGFASILAVVVLIGLVTSTALFVRSENLRSIADRSASQLADESHRLAKALNDAELERKAKSAALIDKQIALNERTDALRQSNALRLAAESSLQLPKNPGLALRLAYESLQLEPNLGEANSALMNAINNCHEIKTIFIDTEIHDAGFSHDGQFAAVRTNSAIEIWDLKNATRITSITTRGGLNTVMMKFSPSASQLVILTSGCSLFTRADGTRTANTDRVARLFDARNGNELHVLRGHKDRVASVDFNHDGSLLVTGSWDGTARIWNTQNGRLIHVLDYDEDQSSRSEKDLIKIRGEIVSRKDTFLSIQRAWFSADSAHVHLVPFQGRSESVFGFYGSSFEIHEYDPSLQSFEGEFAGGGGGVGGWTTSSLKPGTQVFSAESGAFLDTLDFGTRKRNELPPSEIQVIDNEISVVETGLKSVEIARLRGHRNPIVKAAIGPEGRYVFSAGQTSVRIWKIKPHSLAGSLVGHERVINCVDISADGRYIATGSADGTARVWSIANRQLLATLRQNYDFVEHRNQANLHQDILDVRFNRNATRLLTLSSDRAVLEMSEDGKTELDVLPVNVVRVWDWNRQTMVRGWQRQRRSHMAETHDYNYESVAFSDDEKSVVAVDGLENGQMKVTENGRLLNVHSITGLMTTRNENGVRIGPHLALRSWKISDGSSDFEAIPDRIGAKTFLSRDGSVAINQSVEHCQVIDTASGRQIATLPSDIFHDGRRPVFSDSAEHAFVFPQMIQPDGFCGELWDLTAGVKVADLAVSKSLTTESSDAQVVTSAAFSPDGSNIAISLKGGWVAVWNVKTRNMKLFRAHSQKINRIQFSADGHFLATVSSDRTARIWLVATLKKYMELGPHESEVTSIGLSPNNDFVVTISKDQQAVVWPLNPLSTLKKIDSDFFPIELPRPLTVQEHEQFGLEMSATLKQSSNQ